MTFISFEYVGFVALLLPIYYGLARASRAQNLLLLAASLAYVCTWDVRGALVLSLGTLVDWKLSRALAWEAPDSVRKRALWASVIWNLATLAGFKYYALIATGLGITPASVVPARGWLLVGLSFYTLQRLTHTLDVYFRSLRPAASLLDFALFTAFFPQLSAGPIERARNVLPQLAQRRDFDLDRFYEGCWLFALGLWKKVYVADHMALAVKDLIVDRGDGTETLLGLYAYAFQIYADFAGYSDMARGSARLFGIDVLQNFELPYFSASLAEYWRRWHVSLSSFLQDYVHTPTALALRDFGTRGVVAATFVTFFVSALWHGTGWTFIVWGFLHAAGLCAYALTRKTRKRLQKKLSASVWAVLGALVTFHYVTLGYVFFRAPSLRAAFATLAQLGHFGLLHGRQWEWATELSVYVSLLLLSDVLQRRSGHPFWVLTARPWARVLCYATLIFCALRYYAPAEDFIYADF